MAFKCIKLLFVHPPTHAQTQSRLVEESESNGDVSVEDLQSQVDQMKQIYDKLAKDLNHTPFGELEEVEQLNRQKRAEREVSAFIKFSVLHILQ